MRHVFSGVTVDDVADFVAEHPGKFGLGIKFVVECPRDENRASGERERIHGLVIV